MSEASFGRRAEWWLRRATVWLTGGVVVSVLVLVILNHAFPFPISRLKNWPSSPWVTDRTGRVMLTVVSDNGQWRFPVSLEHISPWLVQATIAVEDERFRVHCGVDPIAVVRAGAQNLAAGRVVSGASTLTMQICRMMDARPRTWTAKAIEAFRALQLERLQTKDEILATYLNMAPYGGNVCGVEAAARRYFNKKAVDLSLGEAALLAGLPQSPARYRPDRHPDAASARRATVLRRMVELGFIDKTQHDAAAVEPVTMARPVRSASAPHAAWLAMQRSASGGRTTIDARAQGEVQRLVFDHAEDLPARFHSAVVVIEIETADIVALVGSSDFTAPIDGQVNGALARRSPGSALKPFVYAAAFAAGRLRPQSVVYDIPVQLAGWSPQNFDRTFAGELTAADALRQSLNIPAILVARGTGLARCVGLMQAAGVQLPEDAIVQCGLSVVVGSTEVTLLDLCNGYATLGRGGVRRAPRLLMADASVAVRVLDANVCAAIDDILSTRRRRPRGLDDVARQDLPWFMWKTGTSARRRDAWAIGHNRRFAIGVWVGRFSGAGSPRLVGSEVAEPLLAALFNLPLLRADRDPPPPTSWTIDHPLPPPAGLDAPLRITAPRDGAVFIAVSGQAIVHARANRAEGLAWFLNGRHFVGDAQRLVLESGQYELRCVDRQGASSAARFSIWPSTPLKRRHRPQPSF